MKAKPEIKLPPEVEAAFDTLEAGNPHGLLGNGALCATFTVGEHGATFSVVHYDCGIKSVIINLLDKSDYCGRVGTRPGNKECFEVLDEQGNYHQTLYVHTGELVKGIWADHRNKDQHVFYHIPTELLKGRKPV
jgi:hypothetical protein